MDHITLTINGAQYVAVPAAEYKRLKGGGVSAKPDGVDWARAELGRTLRRARETAGFSQAELADKMSKSQTLVSRIESGEVSAGERYVVAVLKACGLPKNWSPGKTAVPRRRRA